MAIFESKFTVGVTDINTNRKIKNKSIIKIFQDVAGMQSDRVHMGINDIETTKLSWVILGWKIKVLKRPIYNEEVIVKTWIRDGNKIAMYRDFEMYDLNGNLLTYGTSKWALINIETKALAQLSDSIIELYGEEEKSLFEDRKLDKIKEPENYINTIEYKIPRDFIDVNDHVHNLYYLDMAYEVLPEELYKDEEANNIEIIYKKQIKYDDEIYCTYSSENNESIVTIKTTKDNVLHAIIKLY